MRSSIGPGLIIAGGVLILVGLLAWSGLLAWFGRLPGDIRIVRPHTRIYIPITSMLLLSVLLSLVLAVIQRFK